MHKYLFEGGELDIIRGAIFYHCGPIMQKQGETYIPLAAGPTTSIREEPYESEIIRRFEIKAIIDFLRPDDFNEKMAFLSFPKSSARVVR